MEQERAKLAGLPADADLKTRFARIYVLDQHPRMRMGDIMKSDMTEDEKSEAMAEVRSFLAEQDPKNLQVVLEHLQPEGLVPAQPLWRRDCKHGVSGGSAFQSGNMATLRSHP